MKKSRLRIFYTTMGVLAIILIIAGFWPVYFRPILQGEGYHRHWIFHLHAIVSFLWLAIYLFQTILISSNRKKSHRTFGQKGFIFASGMFAMGLLITAFFLFEHFHNGEISSLNEAFLETSAPVVDILQFAIFIFLGWKHRNKIQFHKRYMLLATIAILPPGTARMGYLLGPWSMEIIFCLIFVFVFGYDLKKLGIIHKANIIGFLILLPRVLLNIAFHF